MLVSDIQSYLAFFSVVFLRLPKKAAFYSVFVTIFSACTPRISIHAEIRP
jgi:hypothetical protein